MHIKDITACYPNYQSIPASWRTHLWQIVVRVETDAGIIGYGCGGGGKASLPIINGHFKELIIGESLDSVDDITRIWDKLYFESIPYGRKGVAMMALSGLDLALWDALAKAYQMPTAQLIGGVRKENINVYATGPDSNWYAELGVAGQKMTHRWNGDNTDYESAVIQAKNARSIMGRDALIMFDVYMSWDAQIALNMAHRLREFNLYWFEDVSTPDDLDELGELRTQVHPVLLAGGEHEFGVAGFRDIARSNAFDIWQPDITWCGGITAGLRICELARQHSVDVIPHRGGEPWGLHLIAASDQCADLAELVLGPRDSDSDQLWTGAPELVDGRLSIRDEYGFGVSPNPAML